MTAGDKNLVADPEIDRNIRAAQIDAVHAFSQRVIGNAINAAIVAAVVWQHIGAPLLLSWVGLHTVVAGWRYATALAYRRRPTGSDMTLWARLFTAGSAASGALWGLASAVVWLDQDITSHVFIAFVIAGMTSAAAAMSYPLLAACYLFILLAGVPLAVGFIVTFDTIHLAMGAMTGLLIVLLAAQARASNAALTRALRLQEENRMLVDKLSRARDDLESRVRQRTAELDAANQALHREMDARVEAEGHLRQAQKMEALGQLTGGVAHDFNNLLAVIRGNAELLAERLAEKNVRELGAILRANERGAQLTQRLLAFSRRQALVPRAVDVNGLLESMRTDMLARTIGGGIDIVYQPARDLPPALVDPGQLENAVLNLCLNARDAMGPGGKLTITTSLTDIPDGQEAEARALDDVTLRAGRYIVIAVRDTGPGIPKDMLDNVWEPFFTTKGEGHGTGLGLSQVYGFMRQSGGLATIDSAEGEGVTVRLLLPRATGKAAESIPVPDVVGVPGGTETILLIEDEDDLRMMATTFLSRLGYRVFAAAGAEEAYEHLARHGRPDLFLADVQLPGGHRGPDIVAGGCRQFGPTPAVFMSGNAHADFAAPLAGGTDVILVNKPFELTALAQCVRRALDANAADG